MKIRLTENELKRIIGDAVKEYLCQNINEDLDDYRGGQWMRNRYPEGKQGDIDYSWDMLNDKDPDTYPTSVSRVTPYPEYDCWGNGDFANKERLHTLNRQTDKWGRTGQYYADGTLYPSAEWVNGDRYKGDWTDDANNVIDKKDMKYVKDKLKDLGDYNTANKRPLHRKGSLNRALDK